MIKSALFTFYPFLTLRNNTNLLINVDYELQHE